MPRTTQIIPEHQYPHQHVVINDNTTFLDTPASDSGNTSMLFVFASPKGRDGVMQTISTGLAGFDGEYGIGSFDIYGQPLLNAYTAASSGAATLHCMRVAATNAMYSAVNITAKYLVEANKMTVKLCAVPSTAPLATLEDLDDCYTPATEPDAEGYTEVKLFAAAYVGRGSFGDNVRVRVTSNTASDKENSYKNYVFEVYVNEYGLQKKEEFAVIFNEDALVSGISLAADAVVNDPDAGSNLVQLVSFQDGFNTIVKTYQTMKPTSLLSVNDFDVFLGIDKYTKKAIEGYVVDTTAIGAISINTLGGISLTGGDDGDFAADKPKAARDAAMDVLYTKAFSGELDPAIKSKNKFPTNMILDAGFNAEIKKLIAALAIARTDCVAIIDCGTGIATKQSVIDYVKANLDGFVSNRVQTIEAYAGKIRDPFSKKIVTVTGTYGLSSIYPIHFGNYGAKHVPLAGNIYGVLSGYIKNSVFPVYDEDIDSTIMDELVDANINFARINAKQEVIRATQNTRQEINSNLSELSNVFILLDIKRDCERMCAEYEFNFSEASDIARFNGVAKDLLGSYGESQVRSIAAHFDKNAWEAERGILHLYVEFVHKDLVKTTIIEIDVNR